MFAFQDTRGGVEVAFTDRHGGVSAGQFSSLNLAVSGDDDRDAVAKNLDLVASAFTGGSPPPRVVQLFQVHGADVRVVDEAGPGPDQAGDPLEGDALVTALPGVVLMVRMADCLPVLLADVDRRVVGAAHAGRSGMVAGVVPRTVARMREHGAEQITAWVGPHVCGRCYEVPAPMRAEVSAVVPEAHAETSWGTPALDLGRGVRAQLERAGATVVDAARCTVEDEDLFSYRRQGPRSGRLAGLVWVRP